MSFGPEKDQYLLTNSCFDNCKFYVEFLYIIFSIFLRKVLPKMHIIQKIIQKLLILVIMNF